MTSIRELAQKVIERQPQQTCFMFHALGDETVKHSASDVSRPGTAAKRQGRDLTVSGAYSTAFIELRAACPAGVPLPRWERAIADAERFLRLWDQEAKRLGWMASDLFGLHPTVPLSRMDRMGLVWLLKGEHVIALTQTSATLERGLSYYRLVSWHSSQ